MASFEVSFDTDNAAFDDNPGDEITRILRKLADQVEQGILDFPARILDVNGNTVGTVEWPR